MATKKSKVKSSGKLTVRQLERKYNSLTELAKEKFKERTGKQIARGFQDSPEFKQVEKSRKRAIGRKLRSDSKQAGQIVIEKTEQENQKLTPKQREEIEQELGLQKGSITYLVDRQIFYNVLSYGDDKVSKLVQDRVKALTDDGFTVTFVAEFPNGQERATTDYTTFLQYMERFYNQAMELEDLAERSAIMVDVISFKFSQKTSTIVLQLSPNQGLDQFLPL